MWRHLVSQLHTVFASAESRVDAAQYIEHVPTLRLGWSIPLLTASLNLILYPLLLFLSSLVFRPQEPNRRKIILSTNMAESSITIPDVEYVVDFCLTKNLMADPETNYVALKLQFADKNSCEQRAGRAGRVK